MKNLSPTIQKIIIIIFITLFAACGTVENWDERNDEDIPPIAPAKVADVEIADEKLEKCIKETNKTYIFEFKTLNCPSKDITDLSGIENFTQIYDLQLQENRISNIQPLASLTKLSTLYLYSNKSINDLTPLSELDQLQVLSIYENDIEDISMLSKLENLTFLALNGNRIKDLSALANMTRLTELYLFDNNIVNIEPIQNLNNLTYLKLENNEIVDVSIISNLKNLKGVSLHDNNITTGVDLLTALQNISPDMEKYYVINLKNNNDIPCGDLLTLITELGENKVSHNSDCTSDL